MNVPQEDLDAWRVLAGRLKNVVFSARAAGPAHRLPLLDEAGHLAANLETRLDRAGAHVPPSVPVSRHETPLALLDTPANRRYARALREAYEAGLAVDRERYGETIGTDGEAQVIEMVLRDKEAEVFGPVGRVRE